MPSISEANAVVLRETQRGRIVRWRSRTDHEEVAKPGAHLRSEGQPPRPVQQDKREKKTYHSEAPSARDEFELELPPEAAADAKVGAIVIGEVCRMVHGCREPHTCRMRGDRKDSERRVGGRASRGQRAN